MEFSFESFDPNASEILPQTLSFNDTLNHPSTSLNMTNLSLDNTHPSHPSNMTNSCKCI